MKIPVAMPDQRPHGGMWMPNTSRKARANLSLALFIALGAAAIGIATWLALGNDRDVFLFNTAGAHYVLFGLVALAAVLIAARRSTGAGRTVWRLVALSLGLNVLADIAYLIVDAFGAIPWVSPIDVVYIISYAPLLAALWLLARSRNAVEGPPAMLDGLALAVSGGLLAWEWVLVAPGGLAQTDSELARSVLVAYPFLDLLVLGAVAGVMLVPGHRSRSLWALAGYIGLFLVTDTAYAVYSFTDDRLLDWTDAGFLASFLALGFAALSHDAPRIAEAQPNRPPSLARFVILAAAAVTPGFAAAITFAVRGGVNPWIFVASSLAVAGVLCFRMAGLMRTERVARSTAESMQERLDRQAHEDELTGLPNRPALLDAIREFPPETSLTLLLIDLDRFKVVNDTAGHRAGDLVLREAALRIDRAVRSQDVVHRLGGDEFVVLCPGVDRLEEAETIALRVLDAMEPAFRVDAMEWFVGASIGIATSKSEDLPDAEHLVHAGDIAMYVAKRDPYRRVATFDLSMKQRLHELHDTELSLRRALRENRIEAVFQPIVQLGDNRIVGFETLARWRRTDGTLVPAADFIPLAEQMGFIDEIDQRMVQRAARFAKSHNERHLDQAPVFVTVNLSPHYLASDVATMIGAVVEQVGVDPDSLVMELTEGALAIDPDVAVRRLTEVCDLGVHLAIDDFGTGYSSLAQLLRFPVDFVKVDRLFVQALGTTPGQRSGAAAALQVANTLGIRAIAEGVETGEQAEALLLLGYRYGQGNLLSPPLSESEAARVEVDPTDPTSAAQRNRRASP